MEALEASHGVYRDRSSPTEDTPAGVEEVG